MSLGFYIMHNHLETTTESTKNAYLTSVSAYLFMRFHYALKHREGYLESFIIAM